MAKLPSSVFFPARGAGLKGVGYVTQRASGPVFSKWPKPYGKARSAAQQKNWDDFSAAMIVIKNMDPLQQEFARQVSIGAPLLPRDVLISQLYQKAFYFVLNDGKRYFSMVARQDVSLLLDTISQTHGGIFYRDTTFWKALAPRFAGDVLVLGDNLKPAWGPSNGQGGMHLLASGSVTNVANLDLDFSQYVPDYVMLEVHIAHLLPATDNIDVRMRVGTGTGPTWHSGGGDYHWASGRFFSSGGFNNQGGNNSEVPLAFGNGVGNGAAEGFSCVLRSHNWNISTQKARWMWDGDHYTDNDLTVRQVGAARYNTADIITAMRFFCSSGNIASAQWRILGIA